MASDGRLRGHGVCAGQVGERSSGAEPAADGAGVDSKGRRVFLWMCQVRWQKQMEKAIRYILGSLRISFIVPNKL